MARSGGDNRCNGLRRGRQRNGLHNHLFDLGLISGEFCVSTRIVIHTPQRRALVVRQLPSKVLIDCFALRSGSCGPKRVGASEPS